MVAINSVLSNSYYAGPYPKLFWGQHYLKGPLAFLLAATTNSKEYNTLY